jgi:hypothetical protein
VSACAQRRAAPARTHQMDVSSVLSTSVTRIMKRCQRMMYPSVSKNVAKVL